MNALKTARNKGRNHGNILVRMGTENIVRPLPQGIRLANPRWLYLVLTRIDDHSIFSDPTNGSLSCSPVAL